MNVYFRITLLSLILMCTLGCKDDNTSTEAKEDNIETTDKIAYASFGKEIIADDAMEVQRMANFYKNMQMGDSINAKLKANVQEVCQAKGCWMKLDLDNGEEVMVKFKDYGFFVPKDISGKNVIINGVAFVEEVPVDEQIHYAEDEGLTKEEIAKITEPKKTYSFLADGVLVEKGE